MADLAAQIAEARKQGHSDDDIMSYLGTSRPELAPKIKEATMQGYGSADILGHLAGPTVAEKPGALARFGSGLYDTTVGPIVNTVQHPIETAKSLFNVPRLEEIAKHIGSGDYGKAALAIGQYATETPANRMGTQMVGDVAHDVKEGNLAGAGGRVVGDALMLAGPKALDAAGGAVKAVAPILKTAAKAAAPDVGAGLATIAGGEVLAQIPGMSYPARIALGYPGARQVAAGLKKGAAGWKQAIAERAAQKAATANDAALAADAAKIPTDVMSELTRDGEIPGNSGTSWGNAGNSQAVPQGRPIPQPRPRSEDLAALERLKQDQATHVPAQQPKLLGPGPQVTQMPAAPDASFVRSVPGQYPTKPAPGQPGPPAEQPTMAQQLQASAAAEPQPNTVAPQEPIQAPAAAGPVIDPQPSPVHANGEPKSAAFRGEEKIAKNTGNKAKRFAEAMHANGVTAQDAADMQAGRLSDAQIQQGAPPRWGNLADFLNETEPDRSVPEIIGELRKLEDAKAKAATGKDSFAVQSPKSPRNMNWAALAKQAGLSEKATRAEIEQAMAAELEKNAMAATAGNGK